MDNLKKPGIIGVMSNWDDYSTDTSTTVDKGSSRKYTMPEMLKEIRYLRDNINKESVQELLLYLENHVHDENNPHDLTLETLGTSVISELYKAWKDEGYEGTIDDFIKVLFQYVEIADVDDTLAGTSHSKLVSVRGAKAYYDEHIADPHAHDEMFRAIFPGHPVTKEPKFSSFAFLGTDPDIEITRESSCYYHDSSGYLKLAEPHTLPIDNIYGYPMYSIWGERTNLVPNSFNLNDGQYLNVAEENTDQVKSILGGDSVNLLREVSTETTEEHGWESDPLYNFEEGQTYTISVYAFPLDRKFFCIKLPEELNNNSFMIHDLTDDKNNYTNVDYDPGRNHGSIVILPNYWVRVNHTFTATATGIFSIKLLFCDIIDGDMTYIGEDHIISGAMNQLQIEKGISASPPIITEGFATTRPGTIVKIPFADRFDDKKGTVVVSTKLPIPIGNGRDHYLYQIGSENNKSLSGRFTPTDPDKLTLESFNTFQTTIDLKSMGNTERDEVIYCHSYSSSYHTYDKNGDPASSNYVADNSIGYSDALTHTITEIYSNETEANKTYLIDYVNELKESTVSTDELSPQELLTAILTQVYPETSTGRGTDEVAYIDLLDDNDYEQSISISPDVTFLYLGNNNTGENSLNGYISSIVYYDKYCNELETEYLTGEYDGT